MGSVGAAHFRGKGAKTGLQGRQLLGFYLTSKKFVQNDRIPSKHHQKQHSYCKTTKSYQLLLPDF